MAVDRFPAVWHGLAVSAREPAPKTPYWAQRRTSAGWRLELAGTALPPDWAGFAQDLFGLSGVQPSVVTDGTRGLVRLAFHDGDRLVAALFAGPAPMALARDYLAGQIGTPAQVLAGVPTGDQPDQGPIICACLNVGLNRIKGAIASGQATTLADLATHLGAGSNCGSCRPEINALLQRHRSKEPVL